MSVDRRSFLGASSVLLAGALDLGKTRAAGEPEQPVALGHRPQLKMGEFFDARSKLPAVLNNTLAAHAVNVKYSDLDEQTIESAKHRVLDLVGCVLGGVPAAGNAALVELVQAWGGPPEASVIGYPVKGPAVQVAMANAMIARSYDFEVMSVFVQGHQDSSHHSCTTSMTALALCEGRRLSGKDFLTALIVGDDIAARILIASGSSLALGWDGASTFTAIPAAGIAAKLMNLTEQQTRDAFGLSLDMIGGPIQNIWDGATSWKLPQGLAARNGIFSAELARRNWVGVSDALLSPYGFYAMFTSGCVRPELLTADLGKVFYADEYFKPYPVCGAIHSHLECANSLRARHKLAPADIAQVIVRRPGAGAFTDKPFEARRYPHCDANFSAQFQVANVLVRGRPTRQEDYAEAAIRSPGMTDMIARTSLGKLPAGESGITVEVLTRDGQTLTEHHPGQPDKWPCRSWLGSTCEFVQPTSYEDIVAKFRQQVAFSSFVPDAVADEIIRRVANIEHEPDMAAFVKLLTRHYLPASARA